jgi:hypothetical protein
MVAGWLLIDLQVRKWMFRPAVSVFVSIALGMQPDTKEPPKYVPRRHRSKIKPAIQNIMSRATKTMDKAVTNLTNS